MAFTDWHAVMEELEIATDDGAEPPVSNPAAASAHSQDAAPAPPDDAEATHLFEAGRRAALAMFVDAHNTGYYINAYTT